MIPKELLHLVPKVRGNPIGRMNNRARERNVLVYETIDPAYVYCVGVPFVGGTPIVTVEHIETAGWQRVIDAFPEMIEDIPLETKYTLDENDADPGDMDGDHASALASAGMGTDEDYGGGMEERI
jgi:hypothetical protein